MNEPRNIRWVGYVPYMEENKMVSNSEGKRPWGISTSKLYEKVTVTIYYFK
jgi:hypothetical protein